MTKAQELVDAFESGSLKHHELRGFLAHPLYEQEKAEKQYDGWIRPDAENLAHEYNIEYQHHGKYDYGDIFPTADHFNRAINDSPVQTITPEMDKEIGNRSRTRNMKALEYLVSSYASWPEFRNRGTLNNLRDRIQNNDPLHMPIVFKQNGRHRVFAGNTRMDVAFMHGHHPKAVVVDLDKHASPV